MNLRLQAIASLSLAVAYELKLKGCNMFESFLTGIVVGIIIGAVLMFLNISKKY